MRRRGKSTWLYLAILLPILAVVLVAGWVVSRGSPQENAEAAYARGEQLRTSHDLRGARVEMQRAIKADPKWIKGHIGTAEVALDLSQGGVALSALENAVRLGADQRGLRGAAASAALRRLARAVETGSLDALVPDHP